MANSNDPKFDEGHEEAPKRFGYGTSFEEVLNEVHRHTLASRGTGSESSPT